MDLDSTPRGDPIPILDHRRGTIGDVNIDNIRAMITNGGKRDEIVAALEKLTFHVKYTKTLTPKFQTSKWFKCMHQALRFLDRSHYINSSRSSLILTHIFPFTNFV